jgi:hypothetical protein
MRKEPPRDCLDIVERGGPFTSPAANVDRPSTGPIAVATGMDVISEGREPINRTR